jgi:hypothetical protein
MPRAIELEERVHMRERGIRGVGLERHSLQSGRGVAASPRSITAYECEQCHTRIEVPFSVDADIPENWECHCGGLAKIVDESQAAPVGNAKDPHHQRTPWDMLQERRTEAELEEILTERIDFLHDKRRRAVETAKNGSE